jgi:hypothetical protein
MTLQKLRQHVRTQLGESTPKFWTDAFINRSLNESLDAITESRPRFSWQKTTEYADLLNGVDVVELPESYRVELELHINYEGLPGDNRNDFTPVTLISDAQAPNYVQSSSKEKPYAYLYDGAIMLLTKPDQSVKYSPDGKTGIIMDFVHWYGARGAKDINSEYAIKHHMLLEDDEPLYPERFQWASVYYALSMSHEKEGEIDINSPSWGKFEFWLEKILKAETNQPRGTHGGFHNPRQMARMRLANRYRR